MKTLLKSSSPDCACGCSRRVFLTLTGTTLGGLALNPLDTLADAVSLPHRPQKAGATVKVAFLYPPSKTFSENPEGWWSWPGNDYDAEGQQKKYEAELQKMETGLGMKLMIEASPVAGKPEAERLAQSLAAEKPEGLLLIMFYNNSLAQADWLLDAAAKLDIPVIFYIGLGVKHGSIKTYQRPGVYFIQSLENFAAIESGLRMVNTRKLLRQSKLLSITEAAPREATEAFLGIKVQVVPFARYAEEFKQVALNSEAKKFIAHIQRGAREKRSVSKAALENAARAHLALKKLLAVEQADGVAMNCLRRGMLKPCMSFATLNGELIPAACENDLPAAYGQFLGQQLTGRPGFQHNPCYDTERNHYYASHCTCTPKLKGPSNPGWPFLLRRFAHTNEGSCAIQVFWQAGEPVTMIHYYGGNEPALDVYAGRVVQSYAMPPAGGCTTNVAIEITDRAEATQVRGHHNVLFCGDFARLFRQFAQLYKMRLADTGWKGAPAAESTPPTL